MIDAERETWDHEEDINTYSFAPDLCRMLLFYLEGRIIITWDRGSPRCSPKNRPDLSYDIENVKDLFDTDPSFNI